MRTAINSNHISQFNNERGAALATSLVILALLGAISATVLAVVTHEARIAGSDLQRTHTFYAAAAGIEKMTNDFSDVFTRTSKPTATDLQNVAAAYPTELTGEGFSFKQSLAVDNTAPSGTVTIPNGPFAGLVASVNPYVLQSTATQTASGASVTLQRRMNNYLIPVFQFGMFSNEDIELYPLPSMAINGRVHANGNIYASASTSMTFQAKVTTAGELVSDVWRNGTALGYDNVFVNVNGVNVPLTQGSVVNGPNVSGAQAGQRGYWPGSPSGTFNSSWNATSVGVANGTPNQFGGQVLTGSTGATKLLLPMQLEGNTTREVIKRQLPTDSNTLSVSRYESKAAVRILIDNEGGTYDAAGIPATQGVNLSSFDPNPLPNSNPNQGGGRALWQVNDSGAYTTTSSNCVMQGGKQADTVRGIKPNQVTSPYGAKVPGGAGISGHILIQIIDANGVARDVTTQVLSMGMTEGEPNAIVTMQRPLWAAFTQGMRDASGNNNYLTYLLNNSSLAADGEIKIDSSHPALDSTYGFLTSITDDTSSGNPTRADNPPSNAISNLMSGTPGPNWNSWNAIVPINSYNVQEGAINSSLTANAVYERGISSVVELNMRNMARWLDGVYDSNLLAGTPAVSSNIAKPDGYTIYVSDRRGDKVKTFTVSSGGSVTATNGMADNEDVYGPNGVLDPGEDVQQTGVLVKDTSELPDPAALSGSYGTDRIKRAVAVAAWTNPNNYFRRSVRLFNGENLQVTGAAGKLSPTLGITVSTENPIYIWGNYNTTGINAAPPSGAAALNDSSAAYHYNGNQVPTSIVADAFFAMSKTWFDSSSAINPDTSTKRLADLNLPNVAAETSVRAAILAGNNLSAMAGSPDQGNGSESRLNGGMINFPRFVEDWYSVQRRWNYVGSFIPLYHSTQAVGPWSYVSPYTIYQPPIRDWAFDITFQNPDKLPPSTPLFQHIQPTGFKQIL
jgi:Tfp pilus assembly protein PilX